MRPRSCQRLTNGFRNDGCHACPRSPGRLDERDVTAERARSIAVPVHYIAAVLSGNSRVLDRALGDKGFRTPWLHFR